MAMADRPISATAKANLAAVFGKRPARAVKKAPMIGARITMPSGLIDWYSAGSRVRDPTVSWVLLAANVAIFPAACSKIMKNNMAPIHSGMYALTWLRSLAVTRGLRSMAVK